jgi:T4 bacteriophage base plate protein
MNLKIDLPTYEVTLPSTGKKVTIQPFTVKEEKILLMALESGDEKDIINATKQIIKNCVLTEGINIDLLPFFDIDYLFIALRAKSVGENIDVRFKCNHQTDSGETCGNIFSAKVDIANVKVKNMDREKKIRINNIFTVVMKYPNYSIMKMINDNDTILNKKITMIVNSIEYIQDKDRVLTAKEMPKEDLIAFVEGLTQEQFKKLEEFIDNFPSFVIDTEAKCNKCGFVHRLEYDDFQSFFV